MGLFYKHLTRSTRDQSSFPNQCFDFNMAASLSPSQETILEKHVQELSINGDEPPMRYLREIKGDDSGIDACLASSIPIIDLNRLSSSSEGEEEMEKLRSALGTWGFFQAIGHGIPSDLLDDVRRIGKEFFDHPMEEKHRYSIPKGGKKGYLEGYGNDPPATENQVLDWSDRLYLLVRPHDQRNLNLWPENPIRFRSVLDEYSTKASLAAELILKSMAKSIGLEENCFLNQVGERGPTFTRFNYYPPCPKPDTVLGMKSHTDGGAITIVLQDEDVEGLQVCKDGEWVKVPIVPHALLVNIADLVEIMSNGAFKSPLHRVMTNSKKQRISVVTFFVPEFENDIGPAAGLMSESRPRLFKTIKMKDWGDIYFQNTSVGKRAIDCIRV